MTAYHAGLVITVLFATLLNEQSHLPSSCFQQSDEYCITLSSAPLDSIEDFIVSEMESYHVPGLAACIVVDDQVVWSFAHGYQRIDPEIMVCDSTLFMMASISKTFTGAAVMQLRDDGLLELTDPVNDYLTDFQVVNPFHPDSVITIWNLMTHTSSLKDNWNVMMSLYTYGGDSPIPLGEYLFDYFDPSGLYYDEDDNFYTAPPGEEFHYCNEAYALLGYLAEEVSGTPYDEYCNQNLFGSMGMYETSWFIADLDTNHVAMPYQWISDYWKPYGYYGYPDYPCGQLRTSSHQLAQMLIAFLNDGWVNGYQMLDSATVEEVITLQCPGLNAEMCLTWFRCLRGSHIVWMHTGTDLGVKTAYGFVPLENTGVVVLMNKSGATCLSSVFLALLDYAEVLTGIEGDVSSLESSTVSVCPNPFNESTTISIELADPGRVRLDIYDLSGRLLEILQEGLLEAGSYAALLNGNELPDGIYLIRLTTETDTCTERCVLIR